MAAWEFSKTDGIRGSRKFRFIRFSNWLAKNAKTLMDDAAAKNHYKLIAENAIAELIELKKEIK